MAKGIWKSNAIKRQLVYLMPVGIELRACEIAMKTGYRVTAKQIGILLKGYPHIEIKRKSTNPATYKRLL